MHMDMEFGIDFAFVWIGLSLTLDKYTNIFK